MKHSKTAKSTRFPRVYFLPWLHLLEPITIGKVTFEPYVQKPRIAGKEKQLRAEIENLFKFYAATDGQPIKEMIICSHSDTGLLIANEEQEEEVKNARNILAFIAICDKISALVEQYANAVPVNVSMKCSDIFQLPSKRITGKKTFQFKAGQNIIWCDPMSYPMFHQPWETLSNEIKPDYFFKNLVGFFNNWLVCPIGKIRRMRILRSLDLFYLSHIESIQSDIYSKVVIMATVLEILLGIGRGPKRINVAKKLDRLCPDSFATATRTIGKKKHSFSKLAWWGYGFYSLRNKIVHGNKISTADVIYLKSIPHVFIADLVYKYALILRLTKDMKMNIDKQEIRYIPIMHSAFKKIKWLKRQKKIRLTDKEKELILKKLWEQFGKLAEEKS